MKQEMDYLFYDNDYQFPESPTVEGKSTVVELVNRDTFVAAEVCHNQGYNNICCLNFASHKRPGGGYLGKAKAQEEDLFRRSNLPELMDTEEVRKLYPLTGVKAIYCPFVIGSIDNPFCVSVLSLPALVRPSSHQEPEIRAKIHRIFQIARHNRAEILIIGAWGCGVFGNDPKLIARLFKEVLLKDFRGVFKKIIVAIPGEMSYNYKAFEEVIGFED